MSAPLLEIRNLRTWLAGGNGVVRAVDGLSAEIDRGETLALLGESGCGKSMTALSILRLLPETGRIVSGAVRLNGIDLLRLPEFKMREIRGKRVAMIFQEPTLSLNPVLTVGEQVAEVLHRHRGLRGAAVRERVLALLNQVGVPDPQRRIEQYPFQLSGGLIQRAMIAIALAGEPDLLIADEPTTALDVTIQAQVLDLMRELQARTAMAVLLVTHDLGVVAKMAHRVAVMYAGEIVETAPREAFFSEPLHPYSRKLFASLPGAGKRGEPLAVIPGSVPPLSRQFTGCRFAERCEFAWDLCASIAPPWSEQGSGRGVRCHLYSAGAQRPALSAQPARASENLAGRQAETWHLEYGASPLLAVSDLKVYFPIYKGAFRRVAGQVRAVDGVSLGIRAGRTLALVGESGCGKTTVGKGILQLVRPTAGSVRFDGVELTTASRRQMRAVRRALQIVFQDPYASLNPRMRVMDIITEGMAALGVGAGKELDTLLAQVGLPPEAKLRYPHEFSGGQRQRIAIARALAVNPRLIVCDEPTSALDVSVQAQILNLLQALQEELKLAYLFITHNIGVVEYLAHEVAVMYLGRIVEQGTADEVLASPRHPYTQALLAAVPVIDEKTRRPVIRLKGDLPSPANPPTGCHFHPRCPQALPRCREAYPGESAFSASHRVRCHLYGEA